MNQKLDFRTEITRLKNEFGNNAPTSINLLTISWEDVVGRILEKGISPTTDQVREAFESAAHVACKNQGISEYFWESVRYAVDEMDFTPEEDME